jgi:L-threonylcarbamoyladenylate synthase
MGVIPGGDPDALERAVRRLVEGGLIGLPTETVYGLAARADDDRAVASIFALKGRPPDHPLIVHVVDAEAADRFAQLTPLARRLMAAAWPGPVSVVLPRRAGMATAAAGGLPTVAVRCPSHPVARALLRQAQAAGVPGVAAPSANRFGRTSPTRADHVRDEFGDALLVLDGGPCEAGIESAIVDCSGAAPRLLRPGSLTREQLAAWLGQPLDDGGADAPRVSGSLESHYAPEAALVLVEPDALAHWCEQALARHGAGRVALWSRAPAAAQGILWRAMPADAAEAAHELFARLRAFDAAGVAAIGVERPPRESAWEGVLDRLKRAGAPRPTGP